MLFGIDVSHYQEEIDWKRVEASGVKFALLKASEGSDFVDPMFEEYMSGIAQTHIVAGTYHFYLPSLDPVKQAAHYVETLQEFGNGQACLPPAIDLETAGASKTVMNSGVRAFLEEVKRLSGVSGMIYTSPGFWGTYLPAPTLVQNRLRGSDVDWAEAYPLWLAHYTSGWPSPVYPWAGWTFWQYSSNGKVSGVPVRTDLNLFNGSLCELQALCREVQRG